MYISRIQTDHLHDLARTFPVVVVTGARQVGKTTLLRKVFGKKADLIVFDPVEDVENARRDPELFLDNRKTPLILDEIQYAPELVAAIKRRVDRNRKPGQFLLTGSQQWGVLKTLAESLAGRAVFLDLEGFCLAETTRARWPKSWLAAWLSDPGRFVKRAPRRLAMKRTLYEQLWRGWLPEAQFLPLKAVPDFQAAYQRTYVERDVRLLADVSDTQLFGRFVRLAAALTAQEINHSQFGRELGITPQTAKRWLDILVATFQWFEVSAFHGNAIKRLSGKPKGYIADTGAACALQAISNPTVIGGHPLWGPLFETAVMSDIRKQLSILSPKPNLYHWRTLAGAEVDILLEHNGVFFPIEVKGASRPQRHDVSGIKAFRETYPHLKIERGLVIAPCERMLQITEQDYALPWDTGGTK
ncbi:MAG: ATP-binding protein [Planctomycetes bacterium]|nr:ATP-binding protein [Planctomycetota bacterium]